MHITYRIISFIVLLLLAYLVTASSTTYTRFSDVDGIVADYSSRNKIIIETPQYAYANIISEGGLPIAKTDTPINAYLEFCDGNGIYFKKKVILKAQGDSSLKFEKKNISVTFCEDDWIGDDETKITIGEWVTQNTFHLKSYYLDYLRGSAVIGYQLWHTILVNRGLPKSRLLDERDDNALYHPDGFPCSVFLNDEFYGIYCWQLTKNRKNYGLSKNSSDHIHLDGSLSNHRLWDGKIVWEDFEVRNPKVLYQMDGTLYDGNNPHELIDETSPYYDLENDTEDVKNAKKLSSTVKKRIITLSNMNSYIKTLENGGASNTEIRNEIEKYIDVPSCLDYLCFHYAINNRDGFDKNWQWFTFNGVKWIVAPYDLDLIFGYFFTGDFLLPPNYTWVMPWEIHDYKHLFPDGPVVWIYKYYWEDLEKRYKELRSIGILSPEKIKELIYAWLNRVGDDNYILEWQRWPNSPCLKEIVASEGWQYLENWPDYSTIPDYNSEVEYHSGDRCKCNRLVWEATRTIKGITPYQSLGCKDNIERIIGWIDERFLLIDELFHYDERATEINTPNNAKVEGILKYYNLSGMVINKAERGLYIVKDSNGQTYRLIRK